MSVFIDQITSNDLKVMMSSVINEKLISYNYVLDKAKRLLISQSVAQEILNMDSYDLDDIVESGKLNAFIQEGRKQKCYNLYDVLNVNLIVSPLSNLPGMPKSSIIK